MSGSILKLSRAFDTEGAHEMDVTFMCSQADKISRKTAVEIRILMKHKNSKSNNLKD